MNDAEISSRNVFEGVLIEPSKELIEVLVESQHVRIERIVSSGQKSPDGFWYDQDEAEWVILLQGEACLRFDGADPPIRLCVGDHVHIEPHRRHRVDWTTSDEPTIWLAVFYR